MMTGRQNLFLLFAFFISLSVNSTVLVPNLPSVGVVDPPNNNTMDKNVDYANFYGRVTDKDVSSRVLKIHVENNNTKFFRAGDPVLFWVNTKEEKNPCRGNVRGIEDFYFSIYVRDFEACFGKDKYFRRGTILKFYSEVLESRVFEGAKYREILILRKNDFLKQLSDINHFLWNFEEEKLKVAAEYDERIVELQRQKRLAVDNLLQVKEENILLQKELKSKLDSLDEDMHFYKVERHENLTDRWAMDQDVGLPFKRRPQELKKK